VQRLPHPELTEFGVRATYHGGQRWAVHVMPFLISGTTDTTLYAADPVGGAAASGRSASDDNTLYFNVWLMF